MPTSGGLDLASPDTIRAMPPDMLFDYLGVRLNGPKAAGKTIKLNVDFTDIGKQYSLVVENGVLNYADKFVDTPDATLTLTKDTLDNIQLKQITVDQAVASKALVSRGEARGVDGLSRAT